MGLEEGRVVDNEGQEHRHGPEQKGWEELGNHRALDREKGNNSLKEKGPEVELRWHG